MLQLPARRQPPIDLDDDRTLCLDCRGKGCAACAHSGQVCPVCRGLRLVRRRAWSNDGAFYGTIGTPAGEGNVVRCDACCEGNQVNPEIEDAVIAAYQRARERRRAEQQQQSRTDAL